MDGTQSRPARVGMSTSKSYTGGEATVAAAA
eukprot:CAMPEP_0172444254 /NCGR_PEP_ID=MMETSP1065-20121228/4325_1 /TAXON_ID=265537 /ORGANISM="Amphiprora paludosa, Strain CCMP125" /LENGTH=30 /DNA_ID= /DNA_START= /DNA_END= /DNA_ORIENTATION=